MTPPHCSRCEQPMQFFSRFKFDHESSDSAKITAQLARFKELGLELGATVTVYYCAACDIADAIFEYDP